jgi:hypothetical protein
VRERDQVGTDDLVAGAVGRRGSGLNECRAARGAEGLGRVPCERPPERTSEQAARVVPATDPWPRHPAPPGRRSRLAVPPQLATKTSPAVSL